MDQLKHLIRSLVEVGARLYEESPTGSSVSAENGQAPQAGSDPSAIASSSAAAPDAATGETGLLMDPTAVREAAQQGLRRIYGDAPPDLPRAVTNQALHHLASQPQKEASRRETPRSRLSEYTDEGTEMSELGWTTATLRPRA